MAAADRAGLDEAAGERAVEVIGCSGGLEERADGPTAHAAEAGLVAGFWFRLGKVVRSQEHGAVGTIGLGQGAADGSGGKLGVRRTPGGAAVGEKCPAGGEREEEEAQEGDEFVCGELRDGAGRYQAEDQGAAGGHADDYGESDQR